MLEINDVVLYCTRRVPVQRAVAVERYPTRESPHRDAASPIKYNGLHVRPAAVRNLLSPYRNIMD